MRLLLPWGLVGATVLVQIVYPLVPDAVRTEITVASVLVFCAASVADAARVHGLRGAAVLLAVAGGGGLLVEAVGVHTGVPFGAYAYTGDLGAEVLGVPAVVPLAWTMMAWPALVVGRTLARRLPVALVGGVALAAWDLFLDPQMVDAGHWTWAHPHPALPLVPGVPLTNYAGWLVVAVVMVGTLRPGAAPPRPAVRPGRGALPVGLRVVGAGARRVLRPAGFGAGRRAGDGGARGALRPRAVGVHPAGSVGVAPRQESPSASGLSAYSSDGSGCVRRPAAAPTGGHRRLRVLVALRVGGVGVG